MPKLIARSFAGGEITPELFGRIDLGKFQTGLALCRNFIVLPHGPVARRPGTKLVREVKNSAHTTVIIPFAFSADQTMVLELGNLYVRFHTMGGTLESSPGVPYEVTTPYAHADLPLLKFTQSADVLTLTHPSYATRELRRLGALSWTLSTTSFAPALAAPGSVVATATGSGTASYSYKVTALAENGIDESLGSATATCTNNLLTAGNYNTITWAAVTSAVRYNVYKLTGGVYSYIGQASGTAFKDDNFLGDQAKVPPESIITLNNSADNYPAASTYHEQRRWFAGTNNQPQTLFATRTATETNLTSSIPSQADDGIEVTIAAQQQNRIRHLVPLSDLIALTAGGEWRILSQGAEAITPTSISIKPQGYSGASETQPVVTSGSILYVQAQGSHVREISYNWESSAYRSIDMSIMSPHLFNGYSINNMAYSRAPDQMAWAVRSDGVLLCMTYVPEHQVYAWHRHDTDGLFKSICTVAEGNADVLYAVVERDIVGTTKKFIERLESRFFATPADAYYVDCGLTYTGAPATVISGLGHLNGKTVNVLADGAVHPQLVVSGGQITLNRAASKVHVGLPITADIKTLPLVFEGAEAGGQGTMKNVSKLHMRVFESSGIKAGPAFNKLTQYPARNVMDDYGDAPALRTGELSLSIGPSWNTDGAVCIRQEEPLPLTLLSLTPEVAIGG